MKIRYWGLLLDIAPQMVLAPDKVDGPDHK